MKNQEAVNQKSNDHVLHLCGLKLEKDTSVR